MALGGEGISFWCQILKCRVDIRNFHECYPLYKECNYHENNKVHMKQFLLLKRIICQSNYNYNFKIGCHSQSNYTHLILDFITSKS